MACMNFSQMSMLGEKMSLEHTKKTAFKTWVCKLVCMDGYLGLLWDLQKVLIDAVFAVFLVVIKDLRKDNIEIYLSILEI